MTNTNKTNNTLTTDEEALVAQMAKEMNQKLSKIQNDHMTLEEFREWLLAPEEHRQHPWVDDAPYLIDPSRIELLAHNKNIHPTSVGDYELVPNRFHIRDTVKRGALTIEEVYGCLKVQY